MKTYILNFYLPQKKLGRWGLLGRIMDIVCKQLNFFQWNR